jgi:hypothetical protein
MVTIFFYEVLFNTYICKLQASFSNLEKIMREKNPRKMVLAHLKNELCEYKPTPPILALKF